MSTSKPSRDKRLRHCEDALPTWCKKINKIKIIIIKWLFSNKRQRGISLRLINDPRVRRISKEIASSLRSRKGGECQPFLHTDWFGLPAPRNDEDLADLWCFFATMLNIDFETRRAERSTLKALSGAKDSWRSHTTVPTWVIYSDGSPAHCLNATEIRLEMELNCRGGKKCCWSTAPLPTYCENTIQYNTIHRDLYSAIYLHCITNQESSKASFLSKSLQFLSPHNDPPPHPPPPLLPDRQTWR